MGSFNLYLPQYDPFNKKPVFSAYEDQDVAGDEAGVIFRRNRFPLHLSEASSRRTNTMDTSKVNNSAVIITL